MPAEIEVKLETAPSRAEALAEKPWLKKLATASLEEERLVSVYYDTSSSKLRDAGMSLRLRRMGRRTVQTVKRGAAGPFGRQEWEWEIAGKTPDIAKASHSALERFDLDKLRRRLRPVFETDIHRAVLPVHYKGSRIEIALDRGEVRVGRRHSPISEIELELKGGSSAGLVELAGRIAREANARYGVLPKAARGYALREKSGKDAVFAMAIPLGPAMTAADCFKAIALSCLHHFAANEKAVAAGDAQGVHQMRVGLRRLRSALSLFKALLPGRESEKVKRELKWLSDQLSAARNMDVLVRQSIRPLEEEEPERQSLPLLEKDLNARRRDGFVRARAAVASPRYHKLVLDTALWIAGGGWSRGPDALAAVRRQRSGRAFAADEMGRRWDKILKQRKKLEKLDAHQRHKLRIKIKKLRYAAAFFASLFGHAGKRKKFSRALKALQSILGKLNDIRTHRKLSKRYAHPRDKAAGKAGAAEKAFAMGLLSGREEARQDKLMARAVKSGKKLSKCQPFWER